MSLTLETLDSYYKTLQELYNTTLNILIQLENRNLVEALEIQRNSRHLFERAEIMMADISHETSALSEEVKASVEQIISLHYRIELLTQQCQKMVKGYMEELRDKMNQLHKARRFAESQRTRSPAHIARI